MSKILIIEDDKIKIEKLSIFFAGNDLKIEESFHSGLRELTNPKMQYNFLMLDMTIPLWDKENSDLSGNNEQFGGERILKEMKRRKIYLPTILLTMFDVFPISGSNLTFSELNNYLIKQFPNFFLGAIFYNASEDNWKIELNNLIESILT